MKTQNFGNPLLCDFAPAPENFAVEFLAGLSRTPKSLPCKFFYDERGSLLFNRICRLPEYYPTRTETGILRDNVAEITALCGSNCVLIEPGSGSSEKTRLLLDHLKYPVAYVPIDISRAHLVRAAAALNGAYFPLEILPVYANYNQPLTPPRPARPWQRRVIFFPGSTVGNFEPAAAKEFLGRLAAWCDPGDGLLIGVDLQKDREVLLRAYNDSQGVTAAFNLNLLARANRELNAGFDPNRFQHEAVYNQAHHRIEMRLISREEQRVVVAERPFRFHPDEPVTTEFSYKYRPETFRRLASRAGWLPVQTWTDRRHWFSVHYLTLGNKAGRRDGLPAG